MASELKRRGQIVSEMMILVRDTSNLADVAIGIRNLIETDSWKNFYVPISGEVVRYADHEWLKFITAPPTHGLGTTMQQLEEIAKAADDETYKIVRRTNEIALPPLNGNGKKEKSEEPFYLGNENSRKYRIAILKRDAPELAEKVINNVMSPAEAMLKLKNSNTPKISGKAKRQSIPIYNTERTFKALLRHMSKENLRDLTELLIDWKNSDES